MLTDSSMWWPSFISVLHDLWLFSTGRTTHKLSGDQDLAHPTYKRDIVIPKQIIQKVRLQTGVLYEADHPDTVQIRNRLSAYDSNITSQGPLTEYEWLLYSLQDKRLRVPLLALRLTPLGRWHSTLKGQPGISIGVAPYTDALMEWREESTERIGWIQQVTPEETIVIGELGQTKPGFYTTRALQRVEWLELRPVFTSFS